MKKIFAILLALSLCGCSTSVSDENITTDSLCIVGASFAYPENGWFEMACEKLGLKPINKAVSGTSIKDTAKSMKESTLFTLEELDSFTALVIMHTHNVNVCSNVGVHAPFTEAFDYVIKGYTAMCQSLVVNHNAVAPTMECIWSEEVAPLHDAEVVYHEVEALEMPVSDLVNVSMVKSFAF